MSSLIGVLQKSGGQVRTVTSQAALIKNSGVWEKGVELGNKVQLNEVQKKYDEDSKDEGDQEEDESEMQSVLRTLSLYVTFQQSR